MENSSHYGFNCVNDTFYNSVNLCSNIMQSIATYITDQSFAPLQFCMDILKRLISHINSFADPLTTVTININHEAAPTCYYVIHARFCETVAMHNTYLKAMIQHLKPDYSK